MSIIISNIRRQEKGTATIGTMPTIPVNEDHTSGLWLPTDIYERELFINLKDKKVYTREGSNIVLLGAGITFEKVTAYAGGGQANAYQLTKDKSRIDICATDSDSVKMMSAVIDSTEKEVINNSSKDVNLFPAIGENFLGLAINTPITLAAGTRIRLFVFENGTFTY
ncbi:MAG: hypothetical protein A3F91_12345 [Flavobacteria bacterium RIFCSPLOWO2_12_FULL_35_11]|nr:MAG: hypothetical protein A3F91_12345 [Flavobacteria bacterium RIFCSPLOWO2_12_FULL_35_11]